MRNTLFSSSGFSVFFVFFETNHTKKRHLLVMPLNLF